MRFKSNDIYGIKECDGWMDFAKKKNERKTQPYLLVDLGIKDRKRELGSNIEGLRNWVNNYIIYGDQKERPNTEQKNKRSVLNILHLINLQSTKAEMSKRIYAFGAQRKDKCQKYKFGDHQCMEAI